MRHSQHSLLFRVNHSTCFRVGGNEEVWWVRTKSPDGIPVVGDVAHERNSFDMDEREASDGGAGLLNGLLIGHLSFFWHDWHRHKFTCGKLKSRGQNWTKTAPARPAWWFVLRAWLQLLVSLLALSTFTADLLQCTSNFNSEKISSCLACKPTITV